MGANENGHVASGAVYVFVRSGTTWTEQAKLVPDDAADLDSFGTPLALSGNTLLVGKSSDDTLGNGAGAAYVFVRTGTTWRQQAKLLAPDGSASDAFGASLDLSGGTAIIGAPHESHAGHPKEGAAYVFARTGTTWAFQGKLVAPDPGIFGDEFGSSVAVWRSVAAVGARYDSVPLAPEVGSAHVFLRQGDVWTYQQLLSPADPETMDHFGSAVDVLGDLIVVGAVDGDFPGFGTPVDTGEAFVFVRNGSQWAQQANLFASDAAKDDDFSKDLSLWNDTLLSTEWLHDEIIFAKPDTGAAYVFRFTGTYADLGCGLHGALGAPTLTGTGSLSPGTDGALTLTEAAASAPAVLFVSLASAPLAVAGGTLVPFPFLLELPVSTDHEGEAALEWTSWPSGVPAGTEFYLQCAVLDDGAPQGVALSNALRAVTP
jgi:hypothetical protein